MFEKIKIKYFEFYISFIISSRHNLIIYYYSKFKSMEFGEGKIAGKYAVGPKIGSGSFG